MKSATNLNEFYRSGKSPVATVVLYLTKFAITKDARVRNQCRSLNNETNFKETCGKIRGKIHIKELKGRIA